MAQDGHVLGDHFVVHQNCEFANKVELPLYTVFLIALLILAARHVLLLFPQNSSLSLDCENFPFGVILKHLDQHMIQQYGVLQKLTGVALRVVQCKGKLHNLPEFVSKHIRF